MSNQNTLKDVYENAINRPGGYEWKYQDYTFRKVDSWTDDHSEVMLLNSDENKVESYTLGAFDDFESFCETVLKLVEYDPDDLQDWLNYRREQRE